MTKKKFKIFSFFSGIGLLDLGFESVDSEVVFVNEINKSFLSGYRYSRDKMSFSKPRFGYSGDSIDAFLKGKKFNSLKGWVKDCSGGDKFSIFLGGPPCPDFSIGGKNKGQYGENGRLTKTYFELQFKMKIISNMFK